MRPKEERISSRVRTTDPRPIANPESRKAFNEFQAQSRIRMEGTLKLILAISSGMLTLTLGAVLAAGSSGRPFAIPAAALPDLIWGWRMLFYSIAAAVVLMVSMIVATFHMGVQMRKNLESPDGKPKFVATWTALRIANVFIGLSILVGCVGGIYLIGRAAVLVALHLSVAVPDRAPQQAPSPAKSTPH